MGKIGTKLPNFCLNRIRPHVRVRSPPIQSKPDVSDVAKKSSDGKFEDSGNVGEEEKVKAAGGGGDENPKKAGLVIARKIMIVVDSSLEAKGAIQWALSHTVQSQDKIVLLHVTKSSNSKQAKGEEASKEIAPSPRAYALVHSLRNMCQLKRPEVEIEVAVVVEGNKEKGPTILEEAKKQDVGLLVLGQKKEVYYMASADDVGRQPGRRRQRRCGGVLYTKCQLHGSCCEEEKQEGWRVFDYYKAPERFLAIGLIKSLRVQDKSIYMIV